MRRILFSAILAGAALAAAPANANHLVSTGCYEGDWEIIEISSGGRGYVEVCSFVNPNIDYDVKYCLSHITEPDCLFPPIG